MIRLLFLLHRYLGVAVGVLMAMWCVSGVIMMYVSYPALDENIRLKHLAPIEWNRCCKVSAALLADANPAVGSEIEMLAGQPVLFLGGRAGARLINLLTGSALDSVSVDQAGAVAKTYIKGTSTAKLTLLGLIDYDQWTVAGNFDADRPLYHFALGDEMRSELYVSSTTGRAVQLTTARERFWNWLGAVPHWLYFAELRRRAWLWSQVLIYTSLMGCFLTGIGIYLGVHQLTQQPTGRWSPYSGVKLWHHFAGLIFGIMALTWVLSGLVSMNPWGWLEGAGVQPEIAKMRSGASVSGIGDALQPIADTHPPDIVSLNAAPLNGRDYFIATATNGERRRLDSGGASAPLNQLDLTFLASALGGSAAPVTLELITQADAFYFSHHRDAVSLPVYRLVLGDASGTRYYMDAVSGMLLAKIDRNAQVYRWLHQGLHRMDFTASMRGRPQWDALMLFLMSGVTLLCVSGAYIGLRRLTRP
jgi:PepSY-associated TM region